MVSVSLHKLDRLKLSHNCQSKTFSQIKISSMLEGIYAAGLILAFSHVCY